jgi:hypothetical protein
MSLRSLSIAAQRLGAYWAERIREVQSARERYRTRFVTREARGLKLLREWLSLEQRAEFDAKGYFDVIGCDTGSDTAFTTEPRQTSARSATMACPWWVGASWVGLKVKR